MHRIQNLILIQNLNFCFRKLVLENMGNNLRKSKCFWHLFFLSKWCWFSSIDCSHTLDFTWDISIGNFMQVWSKHNATLRWKFKYNCLFVSLDQQVTKNNKPNFFVWVFVVAIRKEKKPGCLIFLRIATTTIIETMKFGISHLVFSHWQIQWK